jgi:hypothetical protein
MTKQTYWLADPEGGLICVQGADERDRLAELGWAVADQPAGDQRVWLQHDQTGAYALFGHGALEAWHARGWQFATPPTESTDTGLAVALPEPGVAQDVPAPVAALIPEPPADEPEQPDAGRS